MYVCVCVCMYIMLAYNLGTGRAIASKFVGDLRGAP